MSETNSPFLTAIDRAVKCDVQCREEWAEMNRLYDLGDHEGTLAAFNRYREAREFKKRAVGEAVRLAEISPPEEVVAAEEQLDELERYADEDALAIKAFSKRIKEHDDD